MNDCIFCKIVNKEAPATFEFEDENVIVIRNIKPVSEVHLLIIPKKHFDSFLELDSKTISDLAIVTQNLINKLNLKGGYKLVINGGKYPQVHHFHWHLLAGKLENENDVLNKT